MIEETDPRGGLARAALPLATAIIARGSSQPPDRRAGAFSPAALGFYSNMHGLLDLGRGISTTGRPAAATPRLAARDQDSEF
jgi:hypothetical protein